jgi:uncharacterized protein
MRIVIPGGTGQVGTVLARAFSRDGHEVVVLSRRPQPAPWRVVQWDGRTVGAWASELEGADVVINLAGRSVNCRYTPANRAAIRESRVSSTQVVGEALRACVTPPPVWLQASTATIYAHRFDAANDERTGFIGGTEAGVPASWRFSIEVAKAWEKAATDTATPRTRLVLMRTSMLMSPDPGGIFATLLRLVRWRLGGPVAGGRQFVSWVHEQDFVRAVYWLIEHSELRWAVNVTSPAPLSYSDFMRAIRAAAHVRLGLPATRWMLAIAALLLRTEPELVLKSRRVTPDRLLESGFRFDFPEWEGAAVELVRRSKATG